MVLGVRDIGTKSADDTLAVFKQCISDLDHRSRSTTTNGGKKLLAQIHATMSDRAATCVKFNDLLKSYVEEVLPLIQESTEELEPEDSAILAKIDSYFCGLHS